MSTIMQKLSNDAIQKARKMVEDKFKDPNALEDLGTTTFSLEKSLAEVDGQLNGAVQSKLDSLKRAVDLMDESVAKLTTLSSAIARIDERIGQTNTAIAHFPSLMQAANARENLSKVIAQVEFFASIPQRIAALEDRLATRPDQIKDVFVEATKLEALSTALRQEMMRASSSRHSVSSIDGLNPSQEIERYLQPVPRLVNQVMAQVMGSVERMFDLAATHPEDLVTAVEIIEMQQDYNERRNKRILAQQKAKGAQAGPPAKLYEDISASVQQRVRKLLDHVMEGEFEAMPGYLQQSQSQATAFITAANQALFRVKFFQTDVVPCLPPHFDPLFMALEAFDFFFLPHLSDLLDKELGRLKVAEILDVISWLDVYKASLEDLGFPSRDSLTEVANLKTELLVEYKGRIKSQVQQWFQNIQSQAVDISRATDGTLVTSRPEDMFNVLHAQLAVAHEKLPADYVKEVALACLQVLRDLQRQSYDSLHSLRLQGKQLDEGVDVETLCVLVNDNQRMQEKCEELGDDLLRDMLAAEDPDRDALQSVLDEVSREYLSIAITAVQAIAVAIVDVVDEPVFGKLYGLRWEQEEEGPVEVLVVTLQDYLTDLSEWLLPYHFNKLLKELLEQVPTYYVMNLRRRVHSSASSTANASNSLANSANSNAMAGGGRGGGSSSNASAANGGAAGAAGGATGIFTFQNEVRAAQRILHDRASLLDFFLKYLPALQSSGVKSLEDLSRSLDVLQQVAQVLSTPHFSALETHCRALFTRYGIDGLRLVQAALLSNPAVERSNRLANAQAAQRLFDAQQQQMGYSLTPREDFLGYDGGFSSSSALQGQKQNSRLGFFSRFGKRQPLETS